MAPNPRKPDQPTKAALSSGHQGAPDKGIDSKVGRQDVGKTPRRPQQQAPREPDAQTGHA